MYCIHIHLSDRSNFHMIDNLSITFHTLVTCMLTLLSRDEMLLPRYVNSSTNFRGLPFKVETALFTKIMFLLYFHTSYSVGILIGLVYLREEQLLHHLTTVMFLIYWNLWQDMNLFCLHLIFLCRITGPWSREDSLELPDLTYHFCLKILVNLTADRKTSGPTKPNNVIINTINHL